MNAPRETTVSLRYVIPFIRVTGADPGSIDLLAREGIGLADFANPDTRIRHRISIELLERGLIKTGDPRLGLRAGESIQPGDLDALEYAARSCSTLRESILCTSRYIYLMHTGQEAELIEQGDDAIWQLRITDDVAQPPAANDFALAAACVYARHYTGARGRLREVHFRHLEPTDMAEYQRIFDPEATFRFGMRHNAVVFPRADLDAPMSLAHAALQTAFELRLSAQLERLRQSEGLTGRVRQLIARDLRSGDVSMAKVARALGMSIPTLRRRLGEEGVTHSGLLDDVRRELAASYLAERSLAISEVAFLLGFSHVTAFYKAFRRWYDGRTPAEFRAQSTAQQATLTPILRASSTLARQ